MSTKLTAATQRYTLSQSLSTANYTMMCWVKRDVDTNTYSVPLCFDQGATGSAIFTTDATGDLLYAEHNLVGVEDAQVAGPTLNNIDWFFLAWTRAGTGTNSSTFYYATNRGALTGAPFTIAQTLTATAIVVGDNGTSGQFWSGKVAAVKLWNAALTRVEVDQERFLCRPMRLTNLLAWWPFYEGGATAVARRDYSGKGRTLTGGTGSITSENPPIQWTEGRRAYPWARVPVVAPSGPFRGGLNLLGVGR